MWAVITGYKCLCVVMSSYKWFLEHSPRETDSQGTSVIWAELEFSGGGADRLWEEQCFMVWALDTICPWTAAPTSVPKTSIVIPGETVNAAVSIRISVAAYCSPTDSSKC